MPKPAIRSCTSFQNHYLNATRHMKSWPIFSELLVSNTLKPDSYSIVDALSACARTKDFKNGSIIHGMIYKFLKRPTLKVNNALIDMYGKNKKIVLAQRVFGGLHYKDVAIWTSLLNAYLLTDDIESAKKVFEEMPQRNVVSWTSMIVGYVRKKNPFEAMELFMRMRREDYGEYCDPNTFTIVALLSGCADIGALNLGSCVHGYISKRNGFVSDVTVNNSLIDMYGKSGNLDSAMKLFNDISRKDLFSWTSIISGLALHGRGNDALLILDSMLESGMRPNQVTFLSVLSACSHAGLVIEGERLFEMFMTNYNIKPKMEHFGCMVDLFVRAGSLEKAMRLIEGMPMKPDSIIWKSLLVSCLENGNMEVAEFVGNKLIELEPDDDSTYVLLWNVYRSKKRWDEALRSMKMMRDKRIKKTPGCSWIEVNCVVHEFLAETSQCHLSDDVMVILDGIREHSKMDADTRSFVIIDC